jgi:hypothetical protein
LNKFHYRILARRRLFPRLFSPKKTLALAIQGKMATTELLNRIIVIVKAQTILPAARSSHP